MMKKEYKGFEILKVTQNDWLVRKADGHVVFMEDGTVPKRLKEAKALIDRIAK